MVGLQGARKYGYFVIGGLFSFGLLVATQFSLAGTAYADEGHEHGGPMVHCSGPAPCHGCERGSAGIHHGRHGHLWQAFKQLDLTDTQKTAIHEIRTTLKKDMIQKRADIQIAKIELRERLHKDSVDMSAIESQVKKIEGLKTAMILNAIKAREEIKAKLTAEQRKKLAELMKKSHSEHHHMMHAD
ncbi:MAG TPA: Spy/CpxP family protein refolding chaperone [Nitrospirota bacterium]|nr:Spy/CpxP family protein refolding chaperone [Nitrospirota bacterium]